MKNLLPVALILFVCIEIISCSKDNNAAIAGKWNVLNDSAAYGVGPNIQNKNYTGVPGDYFDFRDDDYVYVKEGSALDTLSYEMVSGTKITIESFGWILNGVSSVCNITTLTPHDAIITTPDVIIPGGVNERIVHLTR